MVNKGGPWTGSMKGSMDRVHRGGPWTWGPCFVYVPLTVVSAELFLAFFLEASWTFCCQLLKESSLDHETFQNFRPLIELDVSLKIYIKIMRFVSMLLIIDTIPPSSKLTLSQIHPAFHPAGSRYPRLWSVPSLAHHEPAHKRIETAALL